MVKPDNYQQLLDDYLAEVAAAAVQFEDVLKQQTAALQQLIDEEKGRQPQSQDSIIRQPQTQPGPPHPGQGKASGTGPSIFD